MLNQVTENKENIEEIHQEFIEMKEEFCPQGDSNYRSVEGLCYYFNPTARTHANAKQKCAGKYSNLPNNRAGPFNRVGCRFLRN